MTELTYQEQNAHLSSMNAHSIANIFAEYPNPENWGDGGLPVQNIKLDSKNCQKSGYRYFSIFSS